MADIATSTIGAELKSAPDYVFDAEATPQNTSVVSSVIRSGKTQDQLEYIVEVVTQGDLANTNVLTIEYGYGDTDAGTYTDKVTVYTQTGTAAANELAVGELARYVPDREKGVFGEWTITTDDPAATGAISIYPVLTRK